MHGFGKGLNQGSIRPEARVHPRLSPDPHRRLEAFFFPFFLLEEAMIGGIKAVVVGGSDSQAVYTNEARVLPLWDREGPFNGCK